MAEPNSVLCPECGTRLEPIDAAGTLAPVCSACGAETSRVAGTVITAARPRAPSEDAPAQPANAAAESGDNAHAADEPIPDNDKTTVYRRGQGKSVKRPKSDETASPPQRVGRFEVRHALGKGAFGAVYRAWDPVLDREVAIKVPRFSDDDDDALARFVREGKAAARLRHPNIVAVFETGQSAEGSYIVSEFVDGTPLADVIRRGRPGMRQAVEWVRRIAEGLAYAHAEGVIHRDIKPANIMINSAGRPEIMDFGLAKRESEAEVTVEGTVLGTPAYMSPEQARGESHHVGPRSDQYSIGVVLYELLTGQRPYSGEVWAIMSSVSNPAVNPPRPATLVADVPRDLEACCLKAMEKDAKDRYADLTAFANDLQAWLDGRPLLARPISSFERFTRWCGRNRLIASLAGTLLALIVTATVVGFVSAVHFQELARKEGAARLETERTLIDTYTSSGLTAANNGTPTEAVLWFAKAVAISANHPQRERNNRVRFQSWAGTLPAPIAAFRADGDVLQLNVHPAGETILIRTAQSCLICATDGTRSASLGTDVSAATWNSEAGLLAVASGESVTVHRCGPDGRPTAQLDHWAVDAPVTRLRFSPNGPWLVAATSDTLMVRNHLEGTFAGAPLALQVLQLSCDNAGERLAVACGDNQVRMFAITADGLVARFEPLPWGRLARPLFANADADFLVVEGTDDLVVRAADSGELRRSSGSIGRMGSYLQVPLRADGEIVALCGFENACFWNTRTGEAVGNMMPHRNWVLNGAFSPDGEAFLSVSHDQTARVWKFPSGEPLCPPIPHQKSVQRAAWLPDGRAFLTVQQGGLIRVWRFRQEPDGDAEIVSGAVQSFVVASRDGRYLVPAGFDGQRTHPGARVYETRTGLPCGPLLSTRGTLNHAAFSHDGRRLVTVSAEETPAESLAYTGTADAASLTESSGGTLQVWDWQEGALGAELPCAATPVAVACSPVEDRAVVLGLLGEVLLIDLSAESLSAESMTVLEAPAGVAQFNRVLRDRVRFSPDGRRFCTWSVGSAAYMWDARTGARLLEIKHARNWVHDVRFSPDGQVFVTCGSDDTAGIWDTQTGNQRALLPHTGWVMTAAFSADGQRLLTAGGDHLARLWDWQAGELVCPPLPHQDQVFGVAIANEGRWLCTCARDGSVGVWDSLTGQPLAPTRNVLRAAGEMPQQLLLAPQEHLIVAGRGTSIDLFNLRQWVIDHDAGFSRSDMLAMGELLSAQRIRSDGGRLRLSTDEWMSLWEGLQKQGIPRRLMIDQSDAASDAAK